MRRRARRTLALERLDPGPGRRRLATGRVLDHDEAPPGPAGRRPAAVPSPRPSRSPDRRRRRGRAGGDRAAEGPGEEEEEDREDPDPAGVAVGEAGEGVEHQLLLFSGAASRICASIRSHQSANHSVNSMPPRSTISGKRVRSWPPPSAPCRAAARQRERRYSRIARRVSTASSRRQGVGEEQLQQAFVAHLIGRRRLPQPGLQLLFAVGGDLVDVRLRPPRGAVDALDQAASESRFSSG